MLTATAENVIDVYAPCYAISDHYPICLTRKLSHCKAPEQDHKTILYRAMTHFEQDQFLLGLECQPCFQSGFTTNHSCESALTAIIDDLISTIHKTEIVGTVLLYLSKAFDLVDHKILLSKLKCYQFCEESSHGLYPIFLKDSSKSLLQGSYQAQYIFPNGFHKDRSWDLFFLCYISMIWPSKWINPRLISLWTMLH